MPNVIKAKLSNIKGGKDLTNLSYKSNVTKPKVQSIKVSKSPYSDISYDSVNSSVSAITSAISVSSVFSGIYNFLAEEIEEDYSDTIDAINGSIDTALDEIHIFDDSTEDKNNNINSNSNKYFTPSVEHYDDGSYRVSSSDNSFDARYLASHTYYYSSCAYSAAKIANKRHGGYYFSGLGNANVMASNAKTKDYLRVDKEPRVGSIITFQPGVLGANSYFGHAAYVDAITYSSDGSIKTISIAQTHYNAQGNYYTYNYSDIKNNISGIDFISLK